MTLLKFRIAPLSGPDRSIFVAKIFKFTKYDLCQIENIVKNCQNTFSIMYICVMCFVLPLRCRKPLQMVLQKSIGFFGSLHNFVANHTPICPLSLFACVGGVILRSRACAPLLRAAAKCRPFCTFSRAAFDGLAACAVVNYSPNVLFDAFYVQPHIIRLRALIAPLRSMPNFHNAWQGKLVGQRAIRLKSGMFATGKSSLGLWYGWFGRSAIQQASSAPFYTFQKVVGE